MNRRVALGELLDIAEVQAWIREGQARHSLIELDREGVAVVVSDFHHDTQSAKSLEISVETSNVNAQPAHYLVAGEWAIFE
jgi:hypothetical protein